MSEAPVPGCLIKRAVTMFVQVRGVLGLPFKFELSPGNGEPTVYEWCGTVSPVPGDQSAPGVVTARAWPRALPSKHLRPRTRGVVKRPDTPSPSFLPSHKASTPSNTSPHHDL